MEKTLNSMKSIPRIRLEDIQPLTEFQRNAKMHLARVNDTGRPEVLTVNGKAEAVLVGATVYERMVAAMEEIETLRSIQRGLDDMDAGNLTPADEFHARLRAL
jgi:prevent-host-death family protein